MKNSIEFIIFSIIACAILGSCQGSKKRESHTSKTSTIIFQNTTANSQHYINNINYRFIPLETTDSCLISSITDMVLDSSRIYLIDEKTHLVFVFSSSGNFISQVGYVGSGPSEYQYPVNLHIDKTKQELIVADANTPKLIYYDLNTLKYKIEQRSESYFTNCAWLSNGDIVLVSGGSYTTPKREKYYAQITDANLNRKLYVCPCTFDPQYRLAIGSVFYTFQNHVYLNLPFSPTIYQILSSGCQEAYTIRLNGFQIPDLNWLKANAEDNYFITLSHSDYVSALQCRETNRFLYLTFLVGGNKDYIAFYDKKDKVSTILSGYDFVKKTSLHGLSKVVTTYQDYFVATISSDALLEKGTIVPELSQLSQSLTSESNPIVCLFKFE